MVKLTIDNIPVEIKKGSTIKQAAKKVGVEIPTLCFLENINDIGACRVCLVEIEGLERLVTACNTPVEEDMVIYTNTVRVIDARKTNVMFILSEHNCNCTICVRSGNCSLQKLANDLGILELPYKNKPEKFKGSENFALIRDASKCIKCMRCVQICDKVQSLNIWDLAGTGSRTTVDVSHNKKIEESNCSACGQCITHCPVGALKERDDTSKVYKMLEDKEIITVLQVAPAVRTAWAESLNLKKEEASEGKMVAAMKRIGFDYVFDTNFAADLTIMEEGSEFVDRLVEIKENKLPMFTSCCPGWVSFVKSQYPSLVKQLSTAKSPQQMFGAVTKTYFAKILNVDPNKIACISVMPCLAKKEECDIKNINDSNAKKDVDIALTTREFIRMLKTQHLNLKVLKEEEFDSPLGVATGAGVIFGATGGVMEAALRSAYFLVKGKNPSVEAFKEVRGDKGWREASFNIDDININIAIASGLSNARDLVEAILRKEVVYDFVEIMACPGGCAGGGGQPIHDGLELAKARGEILYELDENSKLRFSHENPQINKLYEEFLESPLSKKAHHLLHTEHLI
ncbi:MAG: NADH-dependent [FeFe] hydrogenase, group A6 [Peptostreptococcaceae bacterium]|jgi:NADH-quinone oxidoreductase subunit G|nr:NADH-dependent [FeFe] hydrogenase, group A6 [Peptostreptococcaceae bacterium]